MILTSKQCDLLLNMINVSLAMLYFSRIPVAKETSDDIDAIKAAITQELIEAVKREKYEYNN